MRLVRLYTNTPDVFEPLEFSSGLCVVVAEIKRPENRGKTVHNLGKSTVARLVHFCLLKGKHPSFFLFKHEELFVDFVFFLEVQLDEGSYLTIARSLAARKSVSLLVSAQDVPDATEVDPDQWAHLGLGIAPAKRLLDGLFGFSVVSPYDYRDIMGYVLREQDDYGDVFHLRKFRGKHREWKPFLAQLFGLEASLTVELYDELEKEEQINADIARHRREGGAADDADFVRIEGIIAIRNRDLDELTRAVDKFDFKQADADVNQELVEQVEEELAQLNEETYRLSQLILRLDESLTEDSIFFSPDQSAQLFLEAGVAFEGQLRKDFEQLVEFNRAISEERRSYLVEERREVAQRLQAIQPELAELQTRRGHLFEFLEGSNTITKYKEISARVVELKSDVGSLTRQRDALNLVVQLRQQQRQIQERKNHLQTAIEVDVQGQAENQKSRYTEIQKYFDEIVHAVLDEHALLSVSVSSTGSLEFSADIVNESGGTTSAGRGFTFKKLLCIAFDLAVLRSYLGQNFPRFAFHDGVFESLEPRAKRRLIEVLRSYVSIGLQPVITTLDSDLPDRIDSSTSAIASSEVICRLSDQGNSGRLFRMSSF